MGVEVGDFVFSFVLLLLTAGGWCDGFGELDVCFAYSGDVYTKTLVGGVLPDGTQRIGRGEVGAQTPLRLPSLPSETSHPPLSSRLGKVQLVDGSYMAESARLSKCADLESEVVDVRGAGHIEYLYVGSINQTVFFSPLRLNKTFLPPFNLCQSIGAHLNQPS